MGFHKGIGGPLKTEIKTQETGPTAHSKIGASSMERWEACPGSIRQAHGMPNHESPYAIEGTTAHDIAAKMILGIDLTKELITVTDPDDPAYVDDEMLEAVQVYVEAFNTAKKGATFFEVEKQFDLSSIHPGLFGTSDGIIYHESKLELEVWDYKHGAGLPVEVEWNKQLMYYGLGALLQTKVKCKTVKLVICQPRCPHTNGPVRSWTISTPELIDFSADLVDAAKATEDPNAPLKAGEHCRFCKAAPLCPQLNEMRMEVAKNEFSPQIAYDPEKLAKVLEAVPAVEAWVKGVKAFAFAEAEHGRIPPGFKLVPKRATRKWRDETLAKNFIALELGLDEKAILKPAKLNSPAQIEALLSSKEDKKLLELHTIKESSGNTLAPSTDKREAIKPAVEAEFKIIGE